MTGKHTILIVEDDEPLSQVLGDTLSSELECNVLIAPNGADGLEQALKEHPDLILLDIVMPIMDGIAMLRKLREDSWGEKAHVILLTNVSENEKLAEALEMGTYEYLVKSDHTVEEIAEIVKDRLQG